MQIFFNKNTLARLVDVKIALVVKNLKPVGIFLCALRRLDIGKWNFRKIINDVLKKLLNNGSNF